MILGKKIEVKEEVTKKEEEGRWGRGLYEDRWSDGRRDHYGD